MKSNACKIITHTNNSIKESTNINPSPNKEIFYIIISSYGLIYLCKKIIVIRKKFEDVTILIEELKEALNNKMMGITWRR
jgi:hypothetical protein